MPSTEPNCHDPILSSPTLTVVSLRGGRDRLIANDFIQVRKVVEHVYEKVLGTNSEAVGAAPPPPPAAGGAEAEERTEGSSSLAEDRVELLCNDQVSRHSWWPTAEVRAPDSVIHQMAMSADNQLPSSFTETFVK